ncbi:MAG TPA: translocation/assembly module TamB domain-containing protein [Allosphingosinicella sp.]|nr:translocation/assembly module TamB domain-containing protein [Allosphingosinicella sp.]
MAEDEAPLLPAVPRGRRHAATVAKWTGIGLAGIILLLGLFILWLNSEMGRSFVARQINKLQTASGLSIHVGRIDGSLFSNLIIHDLRLSDSKGPFFTATEARMGWRPLAYFGNHIDIKSLDVPRAHLYRLPQFKPTKTAPNQPLLPNIDIDVGRLKVDRIMVDPAVTGYRHLLTLGGNAKIASGRAQVTLAAGAIAAPNLPGGDRLLLKLDAVPDQNKLDMGLRIMAPANGFVAKLAHLSQPLAASVNGKGSWADWNGRAVATLGGKAFADIAIGGRDGTFTFTGPLAPGLMMADGPVRRLLDPSVQMNLVATFDHRRADTKLRLSSPTLAIGAQGLVDLGQSSFTNFEMAARLSRPGAMLPNLSGRDVRLAMVLNGAFRTPTIAYRLRAATLGFNGTIVEGLEARGRARVNIDRITIPLSAHARRISGLNPTFGSLLDNVALDGTINIAGTKLLSDDLRIRSDKLNATAIVVADLASGTYQGGIQGRVNNFRIEGIGLLDISTHMNVVTAGRGFGIRGQMAVRTRRIDNGTARGLLEGNATATANIVMDPNGVVHVAGLRLSSPGLRVTSGSGTYTLRTGAIDFRGTGVSHSYGPLAVIVTGTAAKPNVRLRAAGPGFGIGLRNVSATLKSTPAGYAINATGESDYGPFAANLTILSGRGPTIFDIGRLTFAGMNFTGRVTQTRSGPFAGTLTMTGSGLNGIVRLSAAGRNQRADIDATANGAQIPGANPILIQRGLVQATIILYPGAPQISGDVQLAGVRSSRFFIAEARAKASYQSGRGTAQLFAEGTSGVPFRIGLNAALTPDLVRAAAQGIVDNIAFHLAQPAQIRRAAGTWVLAPTQVVLPQGNVLLAGRYGPAGYQLQSRMDGLDLSILNAISPSLGIGGKATGSLDFAAPAGGGFPRAEARLNVAGFTRTGIATRSPPVDLSLLGMLQTSGASLDAVIRRGGALVGRAQVRLQPVGTGGSWLDRLMAAPLSGGIRYNGPAEVLSSFAGLADEQVSGPIGVGADFSGRLDNPQFNGIVRAANLIFVDEQYGTRITGIALQGRFTNSTLQIEQLSGHAGRGTISGSGSVGFAAASGYPIDIRMHMQDAQLARSDNLAATVTGDLAITNDRADGALIAGTLDVANLRYEIVRQGAAQVVELQGVRRKGEPLPDPAHPRQAEAEKAPGIWKLDLRLRADNQVFVAGMGLESEWSANLRIRGTTATPQLIGRMEVVRGTFSFSGQRFELSTGTINFTGDRPPDPELAIQASADISDVTVNINVTGTANNPQIAFTSDPSLPQDEIMARMLFGGSISELSVMQVASIASSLNSLRGGGGGLNPLGKLRSASGLSRLRILGADQTTGRGTALAAGFYLSNKIYIELITDARGYTATQIELALSKTLSLLSDVSTQGSTNNVNLRYRKRY